MHSDAVRLISRVFAVKQSISLRLCLNAGLTADSVDFSGYSLRTVLCDNVNRLRNGVSIDDDIVSRVSKVVVVSSAIV